MESSPNSAYSGDSPKEGTDSPLFGGPRNFF